MDSPPEVRVESSPGAMRRVAAPRRQPAREALEELALLRRQVEMLWEQLEVLRDQVSGQ